ncbi:hypothetical protein NC651_010129 [Populus alba x Populus x berolinensis]|nr:hypothetical protein NC651_010129 [Populus alba x Populus x berolinensis]
MSFRRLVVLNGQQEILWSSNVSAGIKDSSAQLTDDGNLVLLGKNNGNVIWESFQRPCNTLLPNMRLSANARTCESTVLTSWISPSDPSVGRFSVSMDPLRIPEVFVWNYKSPYWRSDPCNGQIFIGIPEMNSAYLDGFNLAKTADGAVSLNFTYVNQPNSNFVLRSDGKLIERAWKVGTRIGINYGKCGAFGSCNAVNSPICSCLRGFVPKNPDDWNKGNWTKLECRNECLSNCSCIAYSYYKGIGCMLWTRSLIDIQKFSYGGADLYLRLAYSELDKRKSMKIVIRITAIFGTIAFSIRAFLSWRCMVKHGAAAQGSRATALGSPFLFISSNIFLSNLLINDAAKRTGCHISGNILTRVLSDPCYQDEVYRSMHVGLLCVQEFAKYRPAVPTIISMLHSEIVDLPALGFDMDSLQWSQTICSNDISFTVIGGR